MVIDSRLPAFLSTLLLWLVAVSVEASPFLYVPSELPPGVGQLNVIDTASETVTATMPLPGVASGIALSSGGDRLFLAVCDLDSVLEIDTQSLTIVARIAVGHCPRSLAKHPTDSRLFVGILGGLRGDPEFFSHDPETRGVAIVDTGQGRVVANVSVPIHLLGLAVAPDGSHLYVASDNENFELFETAMYQRIEQESPHLDGGSFWGLAAGRTTSHVYLGDQPGGRVLVANGYTGSEIESVELGGSPWGIAVHPTTSMVFVAVSRPNSELVAVDVERYEVVGRVAVPEGSAAVTLDPGGQRAYVVSSADGRGVVSFVDTATLQVTGQAEFSGVARFWGADFIGAPSASSVSATSPEMGEAGGGCAIGNRASASPSVLGLFSMIGVTLLLARAPRRLILAARH